MSEPIIVVAGFSPTNKTPGFHGATISPAGRSSSSAFRKKVLLVGLLGATGATATVNTVYDIFQESDADRFGARSELRRMCATALRVEGVTLKAIAVADPSGSPAAATATITIGGTWTAAWTAKAFSIRSGQRISKTLRRFETFARFCLTTRKACQNNSLVRNALFDSSLYQVSQCLFLVHKKQLQKHSCYGMVVYLQHHTASVV